MSSRWPLVTVNLLFGAFAGIAVPFLPAYYRSLGFAGWQLGLLLSVLPIFVTTAPPLWGHLADKTGQIDRVVTLLALGVLCALALLLRMRTFTEVLAVVALYGFFYSGLSPVMDALMLNRVSQVGGSYSRLRVFASFGFILSSALFGWKGKAPGPDIVRVGLVVMGATAAASLLLRSRKARLPEKRLRDGAAIFAHRETRLLLLACALHWVAAAPFHALMSVHILALGFPTWVIGATFSVSVASEATLMLVYPRIFGRFQARQILALAFLVSGIRWVGISLAHSGPMLVALALLHAATFGLFFIAATEALARRVPDSLRASAQGMMVSVVMGAGGVAGYSLSGYLYDRIGGSRLFMLAAVLECVAVAIALKMRPTNKTTRIEDPILPDPGLEA